MIVAAVGLSSVSQVRAAGGDPAKGKGYYAQWCSPCHGENGKGDGMVAASLNPKPRNHTDDKLMSTRTDQDIFQTIKGGGVAVKKSPFMPSFGPPAPTNNWGATLNDQQIWDLVAFIRTLHRGSSSNHGSSK
ncbi:MAG: cytochrome c [Candidatus Tectomicrobia bacterium]|uniref:Cytochrome c n=1 Tax=Tectimicrobiota bacterium TaxID=2528274 RepID=A0A932FVT4_UNCTE|nr:cytochrome c [Candidatus Tectomicrobia bacterium]